MTARTPTRIATLLCASLLVAAACAKPDAETPTAPAAVPHPGPAGSAGGASGTTWDFVQLSGTEGPQGNTKTYTNGGAGSIVASVSATTPVSEVYSKGFADAVASGERGLGICQDSGIDGACSGSEIGAAAEDSTLASLYLNCTGLTSGSSVTSVTLSSLQAGDGWSISSSADGSSYTQFSSGVSTGVVTMTIAVPAGVKYLRFDVGDGNNGANDYLVQSVTTAPVGAN
jgi:hypothetical protein